MGFFSKITGKEHGFVSAFLRKLSKKQVVLKSPRNQIQGNYNFTSKEMETASAVIAEETRVQDRARAEGSQEL